MKLLNYIPSILKNKFLLTGVGFVLLFLFFDKNDLFTQIERYQELKELKKSREYYRAQIDAAKTEISLLKQNADYLEKIAREKFYMKRDNEDVFVIEPSSSENKK